MAAPALVRCRAFKVGKFVDWLMPVTYALPAALRRCLCLHRLVAAEVCGVVQIRAVRVELGHERVAKKDCAAAEIALQSPARYRKLRTRSRPSRKRVPMNQLRYHRFIQVGAAAEKSRISKSRALRVELRGERVCRSALCCLKRSRGQRKI